MTKKKLRKVLTAIAKEYACTKLGEGLVADLCDVEHLVLCHKNDDLRGYLLETEMCPAEDEIDYYLEKYSTAIGIIDMFMQTLDSLENEHGLIEKVDDVS